MRGPTTARIGAAPLDAAGAWARSCFAAAVVGLGFIGSGDDVSGAAIGQATIGEPVETPFHSGGYASYPERINLVCGAPSPSSYPQSACPPQSHGTVRKH